jgi:hypothetical protein
MKEKLANLKNEFIENIKTIDSSKNLESLEKDFL